jgi:hypothetical protein
MLTVFFIINMTVQEAKTIVRQWVQEQAVQMPGFIGAFYHGSINWMDDNDTFPDTSDADVIIVVTDPAIYTAGKFRYKHLVLEVTYMPPEEFQSAEQLLSKFYWAGSIKNPGIIADINGHLSAVLQEAAEKYADAYWVRRRCQDAKERSLRFMTALKDAPLHDQVTNWLFCRGLMAHMLLVAGLQNPTVRKRYVDVRRLLAWYDALEFHEQLLKSAGFANMSAGDVEGHLVTLTAVFDDAAAVIRTPYRFAADISPAGRPIVIDGSYELIKAGYHREAMFWITATHCRCQHVLSLDAPVAMQEQHKYGFMRLLDELHITSAEERAASDQAAAQFIETVDSMAEMIIMSRS